MIWVYVVTAEDEYATRFILAVFDNIENAGKLIDKCTLDGGFFCSKSVINYDIEETFLRTKPF